VKPIERQNMFEGLPFIPYEGFVRKGIIHIIYRLARSNLLFVLGNSIY